MQSLQTEQELRIDVMELKKAALLYRAINHRLRQEMLRIIHNQMRMTVTDIYVKLRLEQSVASQHLAILRKAGLVNTEREGKNIFYSVNYGKLKTIHLKAEEINHQG